MGSYLELVNELTNQDANAAYCAFNELVALSESSNEVYSFFDTFVAMLKDQNSYIRTRGMLLIAENTKWDQENKTEAIIGTYLNCILDEKPITARQCIQSLPKMVENKPNLKEVVTQKLAIADFSKYKPTMKPLLEKDRKCALQSINK